MCMRNGSRKSGPGFTLIELLVTAAVIGVLLAILVPTLSRAREAGRSARCLANLHSTGQAIKAYMGENNDFYPPMAFLPTLESVNNPSGPRRPMAEVLGPQAGKQRGVFHCPADRIIDPGGLSSDADNLTDLGRPTHGETTWFQWQGSSYEPLPALSIVGPDGRWLLSGENRVTPQLAQVLGAEGQDAQDILGLLSRMPLVYDYEAFHPKTNDSFLAGKLVLYADFHSEPGRKLLGE
jgi:prepilin-type N-terminal cleavage/methylation domain-containing protein